MRLLRKSCIKLELSRKRGSGCHVLRPQPPNDTDVLSALPLSNDWSPPVTILIATYKETFGDIVDRQTWSPSPSSS
ncbi:hypothetical protein M407DRAFT_247184 [Tulasnella calospora MUT 4182]|uniref:Uncharacterized protein n=1 Tax=Tulasnella calospora MUT 4182 TaxID=1051891 RepID=A0A0C3K2F4_9AGAM|nr:hypothetical protein M407DRAFT_247184 [Tulasnella calospora MUT 4182]